MFRPSAPRNLISESNPAVLQNAVVVKEAEVYYRKIYESYEDAWTIRDRHMFNALVGEPRVLHCSSQGKAARNL